jgi:hypothetical protein
MVLSKGSIEWALAHLRAIGDTDLFPRPVELDALLSEKDHLINILTTRDVTQFKPGAARRFMVPKDEFGFRRATQLHLMDSVILTAIIHQFGNLVEIQRRPQSEKRVFSYRFNPQLDYWLYDRASDWTQFWSEALSKCANYSHALLLDVSDFYNQIYHHVVENQLNEAGLSKGAVKWILGLLINLCVSVSS